MATATTAVSVAMTRSRRPDSTIMVAVTTMSTRAMPRAGSTTTRPISGAAQPSARNSVRTRAGRAGWPTRPAGCRSRSAPAPPRPGASPCAAAGSSWRTPGPAGSAAGGRRTRPAAAWSDRAGCSSTSGPALLPPADYGITGRRPDRPGRGDPRQFGRHQATGYRGLLTLKTEDPVPDLPHRGSGHVGAVAGVLDHDEHHVPGVVAGRERGEHRGRVLAEQLGGSGLARHADLVQREAAKGARRGALGHHPGQRVADVRQGLAGDRQVPDHRRVDLLDHLAGGRRHQRLAEPRAVQRAAVGQGSIGVGKLERRDGDVALADRGDGGLAGLPLPSALAVLPLDLLHVAAELLAVLAPVLAGAGVVLPQVVQPLPGRDGAGGLLGQVDAGVLAEAPVELHLLHLLHRGGRRRLVVGPRVVLEVH